MGGGLPPTRDGRLLSADILNRAVGDIWLMARKRRRGRDPNFISIPFTQGLSLGAMTSNQVLESVVLDTLLQPLRVISLDFTFRLESETNEDIVLQFGVNHAAYTVTQIGECIDARPLSRDDKVAIEQSNRLVRPLGTVYHNSTSTEDADLWDDGRQHRVKLNWRIGQPESLAFFVINRSAATLTTGAVVTMDGIAYCRWL